MLTAARYPDATVCLLSALQFHELGTQMPGRVWVAREKGDWSPKASPTSLEFTYMSGSSFTEGKRAHEVEGVSVQEFSPAKTVADCFKFRGEGWARGGNRGASSVGMSRYSDIAILARREGVSFL